MMLRVLMLSAALVAASAPTAGESLAHLPEQAPPGSLSPTADQPPAPQPRTPEPPPRAGQPAKPPGPPPDTVVQPRRARGRDVNVHVELTISDQSGAGAPQKKVVSMLVADDTVGRIRASADAERPGMGYVGTGLNVDARPTLLENDRILLGLTIEYTPFREGGQVAQRPTVLNESLSVIVENGKALVISQAADPVTDRRMTVEVRASIAK